VSRIKLQRAQASNYLYASRRRYLRDRRQALNHGLVSRKDCSTRAIQSR